jgi:tol-pal system protein YbgF
MKKSSIVKVLLFLLICGCASQQDVVTLEERLMALERQNQQLQRQTGQLEQQVRDQVESMGKTSQMTEKDLRTQYARLNAGLDTLQQDYRLLIGRIEELEYNLERRTTDFENASKRIDAISLQVSQVEQYLNLEKEAETRREAATSEGAAKPASSEQQVYEEAKKAYDANQMEKARQLFQDLIKQYPKSENADNAQFWIGESYYQDKWYEKAILEYQVVIEKYPKGNKVPAALLKQGLSFIQLGDKSNARLILNELIKKYPDSSEARIAGQKLKEL